MSLSFSTKARTLALLANRLQSACVAPLVYFGVGEWQADRTACLDAVRDSLEDGPFIVRSSSRLEDGEGGSNAGAFLSVLDVDAAGLEAAVDEVVGSYASLDAADEVLVQPMLKAVRRSGVAFSHNPNTCSPYRVINWLEGDDTTAVTGGQGGRTWQQAARAPGPAPAALAGVLALVDELETLFGDTPLDCEFAVTAEGGDETLWLLQARPMLLPGEPETAAEQAQRLQRIADKVARGLGPHPFLMGKCTAYGVMPDWNPAEIIGIRPRPLALSLYRELVTDAIWAYQRNNYGYRNLRSFPLMPHFFGLPYVDVRLSFNSFIPADLDEDLAGRLVDYYMDRLLQEPTLHDKVEFEIVFSCYTLDMQERLQSLRKAGFSEDDCAAIADSLRRLTNRIVHPKTGLWRTDAAKLETLQARHRTLLENSRDPLERIYWLVEDGKRYGTLPFAGLARAGFVAVQMLRSLVSVGVFSEADYGAFMAGVSTVSGQLVRDRAALDRDGFLARYGHLRPGTYDIESPRYDEAPELYFDWSRPPSDPEPVKPFSLTLPQMRQLTALLEEHGLDPDPVGLLDFLQSAIELREFAKFHFTHNLSDALSEIGGLGRELGFTTQDLAFADIRTFMEMHIAATDPSRSLAHSIEQGRQRYEQTLKVSLPQLIVQPEDVWAFESPETSPNFITQKQVTASVVSYSDRDRLKDAIVCIPNADPGFDWLFSYPIAGLITAWGGANSHMAIRAGELGLPAVIGAGEAHYGRWSAAGRLHLDCAGQRVEVLA